MKKSARKRVHTILPEQPESNSRLLKKSLSLYVASFTHVILLSLLLGIVVFIPRFITDFLGQDIFYDLPVLSPHRLWFLLINLVAILFFIAIFWRVYCVNRGVHEPFIEDFSVGLKKTLYVFLATLLQYLIIFTVTLLIIGLLILLNRYNLLFTQYPIAILVTTIAIIGQFFLLLYVFTLFIFLVPLIAIENKGILSSIERSVYLVWNHWWRTFTLQLTPWICFILVLVFLKFIFNIDIHLYFFEDTSHAPWIALLQFILFVIFIPWVAALLLVQLKDLELRKHITQKDKNAIK